MRMRKFLAAALAVVMLIGMLPAASATVTNPPANTENGITLGKQASELAGSDTTITLDVVAIGAFAALLGAEVYYEKRM